MQTAHLSDTEAHHRQPRRQASLGLGQLLLALVAVVLLPPLAANGLVTWRAVTTNRAASEERLQATARALALAVEGEIARIKPALVPLVGSTLIGADASPQQLAEFHRLSTRQAEAFGTWVWLSGPPPDLLPIVLTTRLPFGTQLPPPSEPDRPGSYATMLEVARTGRPAVSPVYRSPVFNRPMAVTAVPVVREGQLVRVLAAALDPERLSVILAAQGLADEDVAILVDDRGTIAARSARAKEFVGRTIPIWADLIRAARHDRVLSGTLLDGREMMFGFHRLGEAAPGWIVLVGEPRAVHEANWRRSLFWLMAIAAAATVVAILAALWLARRLLQPVAALTDQATEILRTAGLSAAVEHRSGHAAAKSGITEFDALNNAFVRADAALQREAAATRRERDLLQSVVDGCADAIFVQDMQGRYALINQAGCAVLGRPAADVLGRTNAALMPPEIAAKIGITDRAVTADGRARISEDTVLQDGQPLQFQSLKSAWRDPGTGRLLGLIGVARNVTDMRREEARRRAAEADLQRLARRVTAGALAGGIAHEVNQPIATQANYLGAARRLLDRAGIPPDPTLVAEAREMVVQAAREALRAGEILRRLRGFIGNGSAMPAPEPLEALLAEAVALAVAGRPADASRIRIAVDDGIGEVWADRVGVQQVVVNLVRNALEASAASRQCIDVAARLHTGSMGNGTGMVEVAVIDDGPGLPPEIRGRLFEAFVSSKPDGMGMGLFISRTIIEAQGGRIWAEAGLCGRGTALRFTLRAVEARGQATDG